MKSKIVSLFTLSTIFVLLLLSFTPARADNFIQTGTKANLAVGVPLEQVNFEWGAGAVNMIYSLIPDGLTAEYNHILHQDTPGVDEEAEEHDFFGIALTSGDFNGDGLYDLAVGVPRETLLLDDCGAVHVFYAESALSFSTSNDEIWDQDTMGIEDICESGDYFGASLTAGDFNGDGFDDLAIGVPLEDIPWDLSSIDDAGAVNIIYGSSNGLSSVGNQFFTQREFDLEREDYFGTALAACDFDGNGYTDLAVGVPKEDLPNGLIDAGQVNVLYGSGEGLTQDNEQIWDQNNPLVDEDPEPWDAFGYSLSCGDFDASGHDDLAIGIPGEWVDAGAVYILYGSNLGLGVDDQLWSQDSPDILDKAQDYELFGSALATGDFNADGYDDLAIGVPEQNVVGEDAGAVNVIYGSSDGLTAHSNQFWDLLDPDFPALPQANARFGDSLASGDFNGDSFADLAIGMPLRNIWVNGIGEFRDAGMVIVMNGSTEGLTPVGSQAWHQDTPGIDDDVEEGDWFGASLAAIPHPVYWIALPVILKVWRTNGPIPTLTPINTLTPTSTPTPTSSPTPTSTPTNTPTPTPTPTTIILPPIADAYISYAAPGTNYGTAPTLYAGKNETSIGRSLFQFALSGIPAGSTVISATFQAYLVASSTTPPSLDVELKRVNDPWTEAGVTWNKQPGTTSIGKVNGVGAAMGYYDWDVTGLVQDWIDGTTNNGLALWSYPETTFGWRGFASRESVSPPSPPRLVITYRP